MGTPAPLPPDNFSSEYFNHVKLRVQESPLFLEGNPFFPEFMSGTLIQEPIIYGNKEKWECLK